MGIYGYEGIVWDYIDFVFLQQDFWEKSFMNCNIVVVILKMNDYCFYEDWLCELLCFC